MLERIRTQPWMVSTVVLSVALVVSLVFLITGTSEGETSDDTDGVADATTTTAGTAVDTSPSTTVGPSGSANLAVVVDNAPAAQPQVGIGEADLLVEYPVEGGLTRFNAVVAGSSSGLIGPVRSLRPVNATLLPALTSAVVSTGGQPFVLQDVTAAGVTSVTPDLAPGFVSMGRPSPHDLFLDLEVLAEIFTPDAMTSGLPSQDGLPSPSGQAASVELPFGDVSYVYEEGVGYVRHQGGQPSQVLDPTGSEPVDLVHDSVVILFAAERSAGYRDSNDAPVSTFDVIGSGRLQVLHAGELFEGVWSRSALVDPFVFRDPDGASFGLPDGSVYLAIVSRDSQVTTR